MFGVVQVISHFPSLFASVQQLSGLSGLFISFLLASQVASQTPFPSVSAHVLLALQESVPQFHAQPVFVTLTTGSEESVHFVPVISDHCFPLPPFFVPHFEAVLQPTFTSHERFLLLLILANV